MIRKLEGKQKIKIRKGMIMISGNVVFKLCSSKECGSVINSTVTLNNWRDCVDPCAIVGRRHHHFEQMGAALIVASRERLSCKAISPALPLCKGIAKESHKQTIAPPTKAKTLAALSCLNACLVRKHN